MKTTQSQNQKAEMPPIENLERIRELLVGPQLKELTNRVENSSLQFSGDLSTAQEQLRKSVSSLEEYTRAELTSIFELSAKRHTELGEAIGETSSASENRYKKVNEAVSAVDERLTQVERALREQIREGFLKLEKEQIRLHQELKEQIATAKEGLTRDKVARSALAGYLRDLAQKMDADVIPELQNLLGDASQGTVQA